MLFFSSRARHASQIPSASKLIVDFGVSEADSNSTLELGFDLKSRTFCRIQFHQEGHRGSSVFSNCQQMDQKG